MRLNVRKMRMPQMSLPDWKWVSERDTMRMIRWIVGMVLFAGIIALVIVFWPTIMEVGQRYVGKKGVREADELEDIPTTA